MIGQQSFLLHGTQSLQNQDQKQPYRLKTRKIEDYDLLNDHSQYQQELLPRIEKMYQPLKEGSSLQELHKCGEI